MCCTIVPQAKYTLAPTSTQHVLHHRPTGQVHPGTYKYIACAAPQTYRPSTLWHLQVHNMYCTTDLQAKYTLPPTSTQHVLCHRPRGQVYPATYKYTTSTDLQAKYTLAPTSTQNVLHHRPTGQLHLCTFKYTTPTAPQTCRSSTPCHLQVHKMYCTTDLQANYTCAPSSTQHVLHHRPTGQLHSCTFKYTCTMY